MARAYICSIGVRAREGSTSIGRELSMCSKGIMGRKKEKRKRIYQIKGSKLLLQISFPGSFKSECGLPEVSVRDLHCGKKQFRQDDGIFWRLAYIRQWKSSVPR